MFSYTIRAIRCAFGERGERTMEKKKEVSKGGDRGGGDGVLGEQRGG